MKNLLKKLNKKTISIIISVFILLVIITTFTIQYLQPIPFINNFPNNQIYNADIEVYQFSLTNPKYRWFYYNLNRGQNKDTKLQYVTLVEFELERNNLLFWNYLQSTEKTITLDNISVNEFKSKLKNKSIEEIKQDLNNQSLKNDPLRWSEDDKYYNWFEPNDIKDKNRKVEIFNSLKIGMNWEEVKSVVGNSDRAFVSSDSQSKKLKDREYKILNDDKINFVYLSFDKSPSFFDDATLQRAVIVYKDKSTQEIILEKK